MRDALHWELEDLDGAPKTEDHVVMAGALARLQRQLFKDHKTISEAPPDHEVQVFSAPGESRERVEIARRVLALARNRIPLDRIAVLLHSPEAYRAPGKEEERPGT